MTRPRRLPQSAFLPSPDPIADAVLTDTLGVAGDLEALLETLKSFDSSSIKAMLFKKPLGNLAPFAFIEEVAAPIIISEIMASLKSRFGGGMYRVSIFAGGKTRKQIEFSIHGDPITPSPTTPAAPGGEQPMNTQAMFMMMMQMQAESRKEMQQQQQFNMEQARAREAQIMATLGLVVPVVAPLLFGGREKMSELLAIMNASRPPPTDLKDSISTLVELKKLTAPEEKSEGLNPDDLVGSAMRLGGPILGAVGRAFNSARAGAGAGQLVEQAAPEQVGDGTLQLPPVEATAQASIAISGHAAGPTDPVLKLIFPDLGYFFSRRHNPGLAAEAIADILEAHDVTEAQVNGLVAAFGLSPDWKADLAGQGLDLRADPQWADEFLAELVGLWTERRGDGDGGAGGGGGVADAGPNAPGDAAGLHLPGDPAGGA